MINEELVLKALGTVIDPDLGLDLVTLKMIEEIRIEGECVSFSIVLTTPACPLKTVLERNSREAVIKYTGAVDVKIDMKSRVQNSRQVRIAENQFKHIIAVGSGKGGVGKSTVAVNIAISLARQGASVGLLDADIYGPNIPRMLGVDRLSQGKEGEKIRPAIAHGLKIVSIGFIVEDGQPLIWRGPMLHSVINQFLSDFDWGELDYLVIDMPPGTGDVQLSLSQALPISGAVVVTTPQAVSVDDAFRAVSMFKKLDVPVLGIVENMSFLDTSDGARIKLFGEGGGEVLAKRANVPFLGQIPFDPEISKSGDLGFPLLESNFISKSYTALNDIACKVASETSKQAFFGKSSE